MKKIKKNSAKKKPLVKKKVKKITNKNIAITTVAKTRTT